MWRQSSVLKWVAGILHMISVCVLAALIIIFVVLNGGGQNHWRQIIDDTNMGRGYQDSRFLSDTVGNSLPVFFQDVELGEELYHIFHTENLITFWGGDGTEISWSAKNIMGWDGEYASMQQMLEDAGVKIVVQENGGENYVYVTGIHTIRNRVNTNYTRINTSGYTITNGNWQLEESDVYMILKNYQEFGNEFSSYYCEFAGLQNIILVADMGDGVYTNLLNASYNALDTVGLQDVTAKELIADYKAGESSVTINGTKMDFIYINGEDVNILNRESFHDIGEYLDEQMEGRDEAEIVMLEADGYPFYDSIRDGMYIYQFGGTLYMWLPVGIVISAITWLGSLIYLIVSAGRRKGEQACFLAAGDRMSGEIMLLLHGIVGGSIGGILIGIGGGSVGVPLSLRIIMVGAGILLWYVEIVWIFLRMVRRVRVGITYWDTSIFHRMLRGIKKMFGHIQASSRIIVAFLLYLFANFICIMMGQLVGLLLFLAVQILVVVILLKKNSWIMQIDKGVEKIAEGAEDYQIDIKEMYAGSVEKTLAEHINQMGEGFQDAVRSATKNERMKAELITNVSHDIKTPLTSIINYVDLIKRETCENERIQGYIQILDQKSQRLKQLIEDLVEASKANSGNIELEMTEINLMELTKQAVGELTDKFEQRNLSVVSNILEEPVYIEADGRRLWRVLENLLGNACKYSLPGSRVYVDTKRSLNYVAVIIKNVSESPLNIPAEELTERFTRGDTSRTTEGSGLGLSIAKSLTELMGGKLHLYLDGDLFRVTLEFPRIAPKEKEMGIEDKEENM